MKMFEISSKKNKNGRRKFKAVLYKIYPDSCIDEAAGAGTMYNKNGITFIREYCEKALSSIKGMSLRCEFTDEERTEILGHGETDIVDGEPTFENAVVIGTFTDGYIEDVEIDGETITACIGEGEIDAQCYHNFVKTLDKGIKNHIYPSGSVEIMKTENNNEIVYKYGFKEKGRIPTEFIHSGYALLGVEPADDNARLLELNKSKEENAKMNEADIKQIVDMILAGLTAQNASEETIRQECETQVADIQKELDNAVQKKNELEENIVSVQSCLDEKTKELEESSKTVDELNKEIDRLKNDLEQAQAKEKLKELESKMNDFTQDEKDYAKDEIESFKENPITGEINSVLTKIYEGIGKNAKSHTDNIEVDDIFCEVGASDSKDDTNIF